MLIALPANAWVFVGARGAVAVRPPAYTEVYVAPAAGATVVVPHPAPVYVAPRSLSDKSLSPVFSGKLS